MLQRDCSSLRKSQNLRCAALAVARDRRAARLEAEPFRPGLSRKNVLLGDARGAV